MWDILGLIIATVALLYYLFKIYPQGNNSYWPKRGVKVVLPSEVGSLWDLITKKKTVFGMDQAYHEKISADPNCRYGGLMEFRTPSLMIVDLDLIKQILVKDFDYFVDRRRVKFGNEPIFTEMLVILEGQKWKDVRSVLSPSFTTGKMKRMFEQFNKCGQGFVKCVQDYPLDASNGHRVNIQEVVNRFTVDVIGATAFGMDTNALKDSNSDFLKMANRISNITVWRFVKNMAFIVVPKICNVIGLRIFDKDVTDFFSSILHGALKNR